MKTITVELSNVEADAISQCIGFFCNFLTAEEFQSLTEEQQKHISYLQYHLLTAKRKLVNTEEHISHERYY